MDIIISIVVCSITLVETTANATPTSSNREIIYISLAMETVKMVLQFSSYGTVNRYGTAWACAHIKDEYNTLLTEFCANMPHKPISTVQNCYHCYKKHYSFIQSGGTSTPKPSSADKQTRHSTRLLPRSASTATHLSPCTQFSSALTTFAANISLKQLHLAEQISNEELPEKVTLISCCAFPSTVRFPWHHMLLCQQRKGELTVLDWHVGPNGWELTLMHVVLVLSVGTPKWVPSVELNPNRNSKTITNPNCTMNHNRTFMVKSETP